MLYTQFSYSQTCTCGAKFFIVFQSWGKIEQMELKKQYKCLKCTETRRKVKRTKISNINLLEKALSTNLTT